MSSLVPRHRQVQKRPSALRAASPLARSEPSRRFSRLPQSRISNDAVEVEQQVARVNALGWDCPLDGRMEHPNHIPEPAFQTLSGWQVRLLTYWPHVAMKCRGGHCKRPLHKLAAHFAHRSLLAIDQNAIVYRLPSGVHADYLEKFVGSACRLVAVVHASARRTNAVVCM